jgi:hypothetical protein
MPKLLFYTGTAVCLFLALISGAEVARELRAGVLTFAPVPAGPNAFWAIGVALVAGLAMAGLFLRMAALLAARNLFGAFVALVAVTGATTSLAGLLFLQWRLIAAPSASLHELHFAATMVLGFFISLSFLSLRPYFSIQASRFLSALVFFPLPLFALIVAQEMWLRTATVPLPAASPASRVYFGVLSVLFLSIAVHSIRHRHLFLETTNLRELLDARVDPASRPSRPIGGVAFDS